ncbi:MAG: mandelate racemase [Chloroflexi bacterium]|nr:mandelate racemase [Chloroflexota bacterium]
MSHDELARHRICRIETRKIEIRYPRVVGLNARLGIHGAGPTVQVREVLTDQGARGWGLSRKPPEEMPDLTGRRLSELFDPAVGVTAPEALPLDLPLHDLAGAILGEPCYRMMGAAGPTALPCYDGAIYMDDLLPEERPRGVAAVLENCAADWALGYRAFKLKIGRGNRWMPPEEGLRRDIEVTRLVRERYPDAALLVDANDGYTCAGFLRYLDAVADCALYWVEEPFPENADDLAQLRTFLWRRSPRTLIADGERDPDIPLLLDLAAQGLVDVLLMDVLGIGLTAWRRWMPAIAELGVGASPHAWGDPLKTRYAAQIAAGLGRVATIEGVPGSCAQVDLARYPLAEGLLHVPDAPGFGLRLDGNAA